VTDLVAGALFVGFVLAVIVVARSPQRRLQRALVAYVIGVSTLAGASQRDLWPFSSWRLMIGPAPRAVGGPDDRRLQVLLRSQDGRAYRLDHRAIEPLDLGELLAWIRQYGASPDPSLLEGLCAFVLERAEASRLRVRAGGQPGYFASLLGPAMAPKHFLYPNLWSAPDDVPEQPFRSAEIRTEHWDIEARFQDSTAYELRLFHMCPLSP
jgi:hypothetical protein